MKNTLDNLVLIGITGGIGSGKTTIAKWIEEKGYPVIYADKLAKQLMNSNENLKRELKKEFGKEIYNSDGETNKDYIRKILFESDNSKKNVAKLNSIVHPIVIDEIISEIEKLASKDEDRIFVESALMIESGMAEGYDYILTVYSEPEVIIERLTNKREMTEAQIKQIQENQLNPIEKKKHADFVIENNGSLEQLRNSFENVFDILEVLPPMDFEEE